MVLLLWKAETKKTQPSHMLLNALITKVARLHLLGPGKPNHPLLMSWNSLQGSTAGFGLESEGYIQVKLQARDKKDRADFPEM